jgi:N-acetylglutamate synthase-like GNAT family acetyltransferase
VKIRSAKFEEVKGVLKLIDQFDRQKSHWPEGAKLQEIFTSIESSGGSIIVAILGGEVVGTCTINICSNLSWSGRPYAIIENVVVSEPQRNQGIGKALLAFAKNYCQQYGCYKVALLTDSKDPATHHFYKAAGFSGTKTGFQVRFNA